MERRGDRENLDRFDVFLEAPLEEGTMTSISSGGAATGMPPSLLCGEESICTNCFGSFEGDLVRLDVLDFLLFMLLLCNESSCALSALDVFPGISDMASDGATDTESSARSTCSSSSSSSEIISSSEVAVVVT